jgi:hypothetical protein
MEFSVLQLVVNIVNTAFWMVENCIGFAVINRRPAHCFSEFLTEKPTPHSTACKEFLAFVWIAGMSRFNVESLRMSQSRWLCGLRRRPTTSGIEVSNPAGVWILVPWVYFCVGRGLCDRPIAFSGKSHEICVFYSVIKYNNDPLHLQRNR